MGTLKVLMMGLLTLITVGQNPTPDDRLYGRVVTAGGRVYEGFLRWDKNEGSWTDILNGSKDMEWEDLREAERLDGWERDRGRRTLDFFGLRISWDSDGDDRPSSATSGIRFGHVRSLAVMDDDRALLTLKSGEEVELEGGSTDLGTGFRGLLVDDAERGEVVLRWRDLDVVEFMRPPTGSVAPLGERLHGTLRTREGDEFTGYVAWDVDEIFTSDILDGEERGRDREIPFGLIAAIERMGSSGALVILANGEEVDLRDSNDVNDDNRGISISDPALGQVTVSWDDFDQLRFHPASGGATSYDAFDGGRELYGTVETEDGEVFEGFLRWDNDESWSWEILDGRLGDVDLDVEFGQLQSVRRLGGWGSEVTLLDGRSFELEDSNDVDDGNKGIFVTFDDGDTVLVRWRDFREARFIW